ncbi:nitrophenyl compound nitroreductase subunit ArsF family protein [Chloroflexota bacterium]
MIIQAKAKARFFLLSILAIVLLFGCSNPLTSGATTQPTKPPELSGVTATPASPLVAPPQTPGTSPQVPTAQPSDRVEVVYFHRPQRCATCLCFEERADYVVTTYFQNEMASGKLTFEICNIADRKKTAVIRKYNAFASQLFINSVIGGTDHIVNIEDIWEWRCVADEQGFDAKVRTLIEQALEDVG